MRKTIWSILALAAVFLCVQAVRAEEPQADPAEETAAVEQRQLERKEIFRAAIEKKEFDKAVGVLEKMITDKEVNDEERFMAQFFQFRILAEEQLDGAKACPIAKKLCEARKDDAEFLNYLAWTILDKEGLKNRDYDVALAIAKQAAEASKNKNPAVLDTLARAYFEKSDLDKAIEVQTLAIEQCDAEDQPEELKPHLKEMKPDLEKSLEKYKAEKDKAGKENGEEKKEEPKPEEPEEGEEV